ncbi:MAG TPA: primosomal protein N' [Spirochaetota bacterium]|nr:primosomal protein N' [Spirochaetota bacterium]HOM39070.1 primosomal protein N' [Spirochaetota bacterium]HPQ49976.1 primosomal protein N' [Spirochaetota bacterium]
MFFYDISLNIPVDDFFTYSYDKEIKIGSRVKVEFKGKINKGIVVKIKDKKPEFETKNILKVIDDDVLVPNYFITISKWISEYYGCSINEAIHLFVAPGIKPKKSREYNSEIKNLPELNREQKEVYNKIKVNINKFYPSLIFGVTGSGKTEIYRYLVKDVIEMGKQALVLIPEISLTPQTVERFTSIIPDDKVSVIHSMITPSNKLYEFQKIAKKESMLVLGPRSALFSPFKDLGIIIIDEEHERTYKSSENPCYNARSLAFKIGQILKIPVILGTATPSLETFYAAKNGKINLFYLRERFFNTLPVVKIVDVSNNDSALSSELVKKVIHYKLNGFQSILFLNRRGFAPFVFCSKCKKSLSCPNCSISLNYHNDSVLVCHYCGYQKIFTPNCEVCGSKLKLIGSGTQRIEEIIKDNFTGFNVIRMDADSIKNRESYEKILNDFKNSGDILIGTQMIAKGLDFEKVKMVGVVLADITLNLPDFRSLEYTFSLLNQVSGRSGRREEGEVIIQTLNPHHYIFEFLKEHDYEKFFNKEIESRKKYNYPPFIKIIRLIIRGIDKDKVVKISKNISEKLKKEEINFIGPAPCPFEKLKSYYRYHIIIKTKNIKEIVKKIKPIIQKINRRPSIFFVELDVDPVNML